MSDLDSVSQSGDLLRNIDIGEMLRLREQMAELQRELEQERQDRKQADLDTIRALGERNDARRILAKLDDLVTTDHESKDSFIARVKATLDPDNLEGPPPSDEERRENARAIQALTVPERFALMFGKRLQSETDEAGDPP